MNNIRNYTIDELIEKIKSIGEKEFRAKQIYEWLHKHMINSFSESTNLGKDLILKISSNFDIGFPTIKEEFVSKVDETKKYLIELCDNNYIETVLMKYKYGYSICISSEVGCNMGCKFCASTIGGMRRNLDTYEMLAQLYLVSKKNNIKISNIVIMGSGEPLLNFDNVIKFLKIINSKEGQNISLRNITISTCGIVPSIRKLAELKLPITLALSLHAPSQEIRENIMPIAKKYDIYETLYTMADYYEKTGRRITFEYSLIKDINDKEESAINLIKLFNKCFNMRHIDFNINLIPVNEVKESGLKRPDSKVVMMFKNVLEKNGFNVSIRRELGKDISGSCGQLRSRFK